MEHVETTCHNADQTVSASITVGGPGQPPEASGPEPIIDQVYASEPVPGLPTAQQGAQATLRLLNVVYDTYEGNAGALEAWVVQVPSGINPQDPAADLWTLSLPPSGEGRKPTYPRVVGAVSIADAERLTGERGDAALESVQTTSEFAELRALLLSARLR